MSIHAELEHPGLGGAVRGVKSFARLTCLLLIIGLMAVSPTDAFALAVTGATPGTFPGVTLNGTDQTVYTTLTAYTGDNSTDATTGWNITFQATQFSCPGSGQNHCVSADTLPTGSLVMPPPTVSSCVSSCGTSGNTAAAPTISINSNTGIDVASPVKVASAGTNKGEGVYKFTPGTVGGSNNLALTVPSYAYVGIYSSTLTVSINSGP